MTELKEELINGHPRNLTIQARIEVLKMVRGFVEHDLGDSVFHKGLCDYLDIAYKFQHGHNHLGWPEDYNLSRTMTPIIDVMYYPSRWGFWWPLDRYGHEERIKSIDRALNHLNKQLITNQTKQTI